MLEAARRKEWAEMWDVLEAEPLEQRGVLMSTKRLRVKCASPTRPGPCRLGQ